MKKQHVLLCFWKAINNIATLTVCYTHLQYIMKERLLVHLRWVGWVGGCLLEGREGTPSIVQVQSKIPHKSPFAFFQSAVWLTASKRQAVTAGEKPSSVDGALCNNVRPCKDTWRWICMSMFIVSVHEQTCGCACVHWGLRELITFPPTQAFSHVILFFSQGDSF